MTFYFVGGEDHDFTKVGSAAVDTATTAARRTANSRCTLRADNGTVGSSEWRAALSSAVSSVWVGARFYISANSAGSNPNYFLSFFDGTNRRLILTVSTGGSTGFLQLSKRNAAGTVTVLATSSNTLAVTSILKIDVSLTYAAAGAVKVYLGGTLIIDYSGDVTTDSATSVDSLAFGHPIGGSASTQFTYWSEIIAASEDTRALNLVTLAPTANGNTFNWDTGSYASINETVIDDTSLITSATAGQLAQFAINSSGITGTPAIRALCVSARAQKGGTGPQNAKMSVRSGGADQLSSVVSLPAAMNRVAYIFATNPGTSGAWAYSDLTAAGFNIGIQSEA